jgi:hypothetical protein
MEKIRINAIDKKPSKDGYELVIVKYDKEDSRNVIHEATLNTKWQSQEVDFLEKDVGIGGTVKVEITQKGNYTNITKVDMDSAVKGATGGHEDWQEAAKRELKPSRDHSIVCQCLLKIAGDDMGDTIGEEYGVIVCGRLQELIGAYKLGLKLLDE